MSITKIITFYIVLLFTAGSLSAQIDHWERKVGLDQLLLKKDLRQAIREAESTPANDLAALLWRLSLYERAVNNEKIALTVRQIPSAADFEKHRYAISESVKLTLMDKLFEDVKTIQFYLQNFEAFDEVYSKFVQLCTDGKTVCDVNGFDGWLAQKALKAAEETPTYPGDSAGERWIARRIDWRQRVGLDTTALLNPFIEDVRKNPSDLETARRYLKYFRTPRDINWLAETFASKQAYDYFELGEFLAGPWIGMVDLTRSEDEKQQIRRTAVRFLQKSLDLPFTEKDKNLVGGRFRYASIPPVIGDYEKQLRYWTNSALAEAYKDLGEAQNAQPIIEAIAELDKSDIIVGNPSYLAGAVQAASGARAVESKILREEATRQNSFEYWEERVSYYSGREEPERVFDAYVQSLKSVPFDLTNERSRDSRLHFIRRFASFADDEFGNSGQKIGREDFDDLSTEDKKKAYLWQETEDFLRGEFERTKSNLEYSYALARMIDNYEFENLLLEIFEKKPDFLLKTYTQMSDTDGDLLDFFLNSEAVPRSKKDAVIGQILPLAEKADIDKARIICEDILRSNDYAGRVIPVLLKNLTKTEARLGSAGLDNERREEFGNIRGKYLELLFSAYLAANNRSAAEKLLMEKYHSSIKYSLDSLIMNAAQNRDFSDAVRLWQLKANLNRNDLDNLSSLERYPEIRENLRAFYEQLKKDEPFSPIPALALKILDI